MAVSATQRTLQLLKEQGRKCAIVEKFNYWVGEHGIRQDMFGIIDIVALDFDKGVIGVQSTTGSQYADHFRKLTIERAVQTTDWLRTPGTFLELWAWRKLKVKRGGKAMKWVPRITNITLEDINI